MQRIPHNQHHESFTKTLSKELHRRIYKNCEFRISQYQFGFVNGVGTREALFTVQTLVQRIEMQGCKLRCIRVLYR